jgi:hypothetical protein
MDKGSNMSTLLIILLASILALLWNILTVFYLAQKARNGMLSPLRFSLVFILGFSFSVSTILFIGVAANGIELRKIGFVLFVFMLNFLVGFPVVHFLSRFLMGKHFSKWSSQTKGPKGS